MEKYKLIYVCYEIYKHKIKNVCCRKSHFFKSKVNIVPFFEIDYNTYEICKKKLKHCYHNYSDYKSLIKLSLNLDWLMCKTYSKYTILRKRWRKRSRKHGTCSISFSSAPKQLQILNFVILSFI